MSDSIVTPKNTKLIAEWMGNHDIVIIDNNVFIEYEETYLDTCKVYNLIANADQSREVEKKLLFESMWTPRHLNGMWYMHRFSDDFLVKAKTLELVIYKAALFEAYK